VRPKRLIGCGASHVLGAVFLVVLAVFIGGCGVEQDTSSSVDEVDEQEGAPEQPAETTEQSSEQPVASVGEPVKVGDVQWAVTDAQHSDILVSRLGTEEGNFVIVDVTFLNSSNQDITLATPFATLIDSEGREFEADIEYNFLHVYASENMFVDHVQPGATKEGKILFSVDPDASGFKLRVGEARFGSSETADIDLGRLRSATSPAASEEP
jgi:uncharacterized protein DUF4352